MSSLQKPWKIRAYTCVCASELGFTKQKATALPQLKTQSTYCDRLLFGNDKTDPNWRPGCGTESLTLEADSFLQLRWIPGWHRLRLLGLLDRRNEGTKQSHTHIWTWQTTNMYLYTSILYYCIIRILYSERFPECWELCATCQFSRWRLVRNLFFGSTSSGSRWRSPISSSLLTRLSIASLDTQEHNLKQVTGIDFGWEAAEIRVREASTANREYFSS